MRDLFARCAHRALHEGHQLVLLILVEGRSLKGALLIAFLTALFGLILFQELWPEAGKSATKWIAANDPF